MAAGRVCYTLGLRGPSLSIDTACTAGLIACHLAVGAVRYGECVTAVAAGVNINNFPDMFAVINGFAAATQTLVSERTLRNKRVSLRACNRFQGDSGSVLLL